MAIRDPSKSNFKYNKFNHIKEKYFWNDVWGSVSENLCTKRGVAIGEETKEICEDSPAACIVHVELYYRMNGVDMYSGDDYCRAIGLICLQQFEGNNGCDRGSKYNCSETVNQNNPYFIVHCVASGTERM